MANGFGKYYQKAFTGSMFGAGADVFALWGYCIANAMPPDGVLELNPIAISPMLGMSVAAVESAITYLNASDKRSRSPDKNGRRIVHLDGFEYQLVNFGKYRNGMDQESLRIYHREKQRKYREKHQCSATILDSTAIIPQAEVRSRSQKQKEKIAVTAKPPQPPRIKIAGKDWLELLRPDCIKQGIDLDIEIIKAQRWITNTSGRKFTQKFFIGWLNRADKTIQGGSTNGSDTDRRRREKAGREFDESNTHAPVIKF